MSALYLLLVNVVPKICFFGTSAGSGVKLFPRLALAGPEEFFANKGLLKEGWSPTMCTSTNNVDSATRLLRSCIAEKRKIVTSDAWITF